MGTVITAGASTGGGCHNGDGGQERGSTAGSWVTEASCLARRARGRGAPCFVGSSWGVLTPKFAWRAPGGGHDIAPALRRPSGDVAAPHSPGVRWP